MDTTPTNDGEGLPHPSSQSSQATSHLHDATSNMVQEIIYSFDRAGVSETDGKQFCLVNIKTKIYAMIADCREFSVSIQANYSKHSAEFVDFATDIGNTLVTIEEPNLTTIFELARDRGIREGFNGYRSLLIVLQRVLEKLQANVVAFRSALSSLLGLSWGKLISSTQELLKQLRVVSIMLAVARHISQNTDDMLMNADAPTSTLEQEDSTFRLGMGLPTECFFGMHFGSHYSPNIQSILRMVMLASASYATTSADSHWLVRGTMSLFYGAYYNAFPKDAAQKFVAAQASTDIQELKKFWNLTENLTFAEKAAAFSIPLAVNYKLVIPPKKFDIRINKHHSNKDSNNKNSDNNNNNSYNSTSDEDDDDAKEYLTIIPPSLPPSLITPDMTSPFISVHARLISYQFVSTSLSTECEEQRLQEETEFLRLQRKAELDLKLAKIQHTTESLLRKATFNMFDSPKPSAAKTTTTSPTTTTTTTPTITTTASPTTLTSPPPIPRLSPTRQSPATAPTAAPELCTPKTPVPLVMVASPSPTSVRRNLFDNNNNYNHNKTGHNSNNSTDNTPTTSSSDSHTTAPPIITNSEVVNQLSQLQHEAQHIQAEEAKIEQEEKIAHTFLEPPVADNAPLVPTVLPTDNQPQTIAKNSNNSPTTSALAVEDFVELRQRARSRSPSPEHSPRASPSPIHTYTRKPSKEVLSSGLIIHFHGGGFVAHTANSHMGVLRELARDTNLPILSVDYRLAPEFPFPVAFQECYYVYVWALKNCRRLGSTGEKIIIMGDSAGGNLAAAVTMRAICDKVRVPDAMVLFYPALYMHFVPSPSRILSIIDPVLTTATLMECFKAYLPSMEIANPLVNPFVSPACANQQILSQMPEHILIMCGSLDPLLDDSIYFTKRLMSVNKKVQLKIFDDFPHGFLNFGTVPQFGKEMREGLRLAVNYVNRLMKTVADVSNKQQHQQQQQPHQQQQQQQQHQVPQNTPSNQQQQTQQQ